MLYKLIINYNKYKTLNYLEKIGLILVGIISFVVDTIGIGSFAINIALIKTFKLVNDNEILGFINSVQVIPGAIEAIFFLNIFHVDYITLSILIIAAIIGGFIGGIFVSIINTLIVRLLMICIFLFMVLLLLCNLLNILPIGGFLIKLDGYKLILGFIGIFFAGFLVAFGVGLFSLIQTVLFFLGVSPAASYSIMTVVGAIQQPITAFAFLIKNNVSIIKVLIASFSGIIGVCMGVNIMSFLSTRQVRWLLVIIITYNIVNLIKSCIR